MYKTWGWKKEWSCTQAVPHQLQHSTILASTASLDSLEESRIREAGALPVLQCSVPKGTNQKTTWNKWAWQKWWGGRDCYHLPWKAVFSQGLLQEWGPFSHLCRMEGHGLFFLVLAFSLQKWISNPVQQPWHNFLGIVFPGYWQALAWPVLTQSAWKRICRAPHWSTWTAALAASLALRAINKICQLNWNFPYLLSSLGAIFKKFVYLSLKVNYSTIFELLECNENIGK